MDVREKVLRYLLSFRSSLISVGALRLIVDVCAHKKEIAKVLDENTPPEERDLLYVSRCVREAMSVVNELAARGVLQMVSLEGSPVSRLTEATIASTIINGERARIESLLRGGNRMDERKAGEKVVRRAPRQARLTEFL